MTATPSQGLWEGLIGCLEELEASAKQLQAALVAHDVNGVWAATARQELATGRLTEWQRLWPSPRPGAHGPATKPVPPPEVGEKARTMMARTQFIQRVNRTLTRVFLKVIDNTFAAFTFRADSHPRTYGATGQFAPLSGPVFVEQVG